jgi:hypothetical protein
MRRQRHADVRDSRNNRGSLMPPPGILFQASLIAARLGGWLTVVAASILIACPAQAQTTSAAEADVKAAFLIRFADYVTWPRTALPEDGRLVIAVLGADQGVADAIERLAQQRPRDSRPVEVRRLKTLPAANTGHILFIAASASEAVPAAARAVDQPVLIVTESSGAIDQGSMINFRMEAGRIRFDVAPEAAKRHSLALSSRLIAVASRVW